jgi:hypothetical protein
MMSGVDDTRVMQNNPLTSESSLSFREKGAWACLITTVAVFIPYFARVLHLFARGELKTSSVITAFFLASIWQVLLNVVVQVVIALRSGREPKDERDSAIESKSFRYTYWIFALLLWPVIMIAPASTIGGYPLTPVFLSQMVFFCFVVAELTRYLTQVVYYRRGVL